MNALVTGGTGFLGANLAKGLLDRGWQVRILRRSTSPLDAVTDLSVEHAIGDVLEPASLAAAMTGVDVVFHVAAISIYWRSQPDLLYQVNVGGTRRVLEAARQTGVKRVVLTSSGAAVGIVRGRLSNEDDAFHEKIARFPYGHSKWLAEEVAREAAKKGQDVVIVNPSIIVGPRDINWGSGSIIKETASRRVPGVPPGGANYVAAEDVAAGHMAAAEKGRSGERYLLTGENLTHRQLADIVARVVGVEPPRWDMPGWLFPPLAFAAGAVSRLGVSLPIDATQLLLSREFIWYDSTKARRELDLPAPCTPVEQAVRQAYEWYVEKGYLSSSKSKPQTPNSNSNSKL
jgi:dihydroflavonol-4-reductase